MRCVAHAGHALCATLTRTRTIPLPPSLINKPFIPYRTVRYRTLPGSPTQVIRRLHVWEKSDYNTTTRFGNRHGPTATARPPCRPPKPCRQHAIEHTDSPREGGGEHTDRASEGAAFGPAECRQWPNATVNVDRTRYGSVRMSHKSYFVHHTQQLSKAAVVGEGASIRRRIDRRSQTKGLQGRCRGRGC